MALAAAGAGGGDRTPKLDMGPFLLTQSNPIQSIKLPENPDPIQSNPKIAVIKANS